MPSGVGPPTRAAAPWPRPGCDWPTAPGSAAARELHAAGAPRQGSRRGGGPQLTPQELQIAQLAARGLSNREIGEQLFLSHRTVGSHLYHLFPKLGITTRAQLANALKPSLPRRRNSHQRARNKARPDADRGTTVRSE